MLDEAHANGAPAVVIGCDRDAVFSVRIAGLNLEAEAGVKGERGGVAGRSNASDQRSPPRPNDGEKAFVRCAADAGLMYASSARVCDKKPIKKPTSAPSDVVATRHVSEKCSKKVRWSCPLMVPGGAPHQASATATSGARSDGVAGLKPKRSEEVVSVGGTMITGQVQNKTEQGGLS